MSAADQERHLLEVTELSDQLVDVITRARSHRVVLDALMATHTAVAEAHACCTYEAGAAAIRCGHRLVVLSQEPGRNGPIH